MITTNEIATIAGKRGVFQTKEGLSFEVKILNVRSVFGRIDYMIQPVLDNPNIKTSEAWVGGDRVHLIK